MRSKTEMIAADVESVCEARANDDVVLGLGLLLSHREGTYQLQSLRDGRHQPVGTFASAADAWSALDELDAPLDY